MGNNNNIESIVLGSGKLYYEEFNGIVPENKDIETDANLLGLISGGASLEYKPEHYTAEDDLGLVSKTIITKEETTFNRGLLPGTETLFLFCLLPPV